jgi:mannitol operon transcriptional antiterminator
MGLLTTRQSNLLRYLLNTNSPVVIADIGDELGLTSRQVSYNLKPIKRWLAQHNVNLKTIPGVGIQLDCSLSQKTDLLNELTTQTGFQVILTAPQRQQLLALNLLAANKPLILSQLQKSIEVSRTTIFKDLESIETWFQQFGLQLIRRQNYGIIVLGLELAQRQALTALLWGDIPFGKPLITITHKNGLVFSLSNTTTALPAIQQVNQLLVKWDTQTALEWVAYVEAELGGRFTDDTVLQLSLSLAIQVQRVRVEQLLECDPQDIQWLQTQPVWPVAAHLAKRMWPDYPPDSLPDECAGIAMHLLAGARSDIWPIDQDVNSPFNTLITVFMEEAARAFKVPNLDQDTSLRDGLAAHIIPACLRQRFRIWSPPGLPDDALPTGYETTQTIVQGLVAETVSQTDIVIPENELNNLTLLLRAALIRKRPNRQVQIIVICPSGMATAQLLVARLKARFPYLKILDVLSVRELTPEKILAAQLIISTIPLDAYKLGIHVIQVHPLLLPEDIDTITRWLT